MNKKNKGLPNTDLIKSNNKKVLFTATVDSHILQFHLPFLKYFKDNGYEVHVVTGEDGKIPYCDKKYNVGIKRSPYSLKNIKAIKKLKKLIMNEKYEIIHTHTPMGSVVTRLAAKKARKKYYTRVIYTAHGFHFYKGAPKKNWLLFYPVEKHLSKYTDTLITINNEDYELAKNNFKKCKDIQYVPGVGIDENKFIFKMTKKEKSDLRKSLGLKDDDFVMICVARLDANKNQGLLIDVTRKIIKDNSNIHLLLVGRDENNGIYQEQAKDILSNVHFLGHREDIAQLLKISDLALSSSIREGLPVNILEAMVVGLPIIATNARGNRDLVKNHINGYIIDSFDIDKIVECIKKIYNSNKTNDKFKQESQYIVKEYTIDKIIDKMDKIYNKRKKVLHILSSNKYSGAENVACTIIENMSDKFDMAYCSPNGPIQETLKEKKIEYYPINKLNLINIRKVLKKYNPDIIHAHDFKASIYSSFFYKNYKIISHIHQTPLWLSKRNLKTKIYRIRSHSFYKIICVSNEILRKYIYKDYIKSKTYIIHNCVDSDRVKKMSKYKFEKHYDLCFFGRITNVKNPVLFIDVVKKIKEYNPNITSCIIGDGDLKKECIKYINTNNLSNNIEILGFQKNPYKILKNCRCCLNTSFYEGISIAAIESLILGVPVLNNGVGGFKEIFNDYPDFICNNMDDYVKMIDKILKSKKIELPNIELYTNKQLWLDKLYFIYD